MSPIISIFFDLVNLLLLISNVILFYKGSHKWIYLVEISKIVLFILFILFFRLHFQNLTLLIGNAIFSLLLLINGYYARDDMWQYLAKLTKVFAGSIFVAAVGVGIYVLWLYPYPIFPAPTGSYRIGKVSGFLYAPEYPELALNDTDQRAIMYEIWYPADNVMDKDLAPYANDSTCLYESLRKNDLTYNGYPEVMAISFDGFTSHAYMNARVSQKMDQFPVLLFSSGDGGTLGQNSSLMEDLASHGFIVVSVGHPYSNFTNLPEEITFSPQKMREYWKNYREKRQVVTEDLYSILPEAAVEISDAQIRTTLERMIPIRDGYDYKIDHWEEDTIEVLRELKMLNASSTNLFYGKMDLNNLGVLGQSLGAMLSAQLCEKIPEVKSCFMVDPLPTMDYFLSGQTKPSMILVTDNKLPVFEYILNISAGPSYLVYIPGTHHYYFTEPAMLSPAMFGDDRVDNFTRLYRTLAIMNRYAVPFFLKYNAALAEDITRVPGSLMMENGSE